MLPTEIYIEIIDKITVESENFLLDYLNIVDALSVQPLKFDSVLKLLIESFNNRIDIIDLTDSNGDLPLVLKLQKLFVFKNFITTKKEKIILLINDDVLYNYRYEEKFKQFFNSNVFRFKNIHDTSKVIFDVIYCPSLIEYNTGPKNEYNDFKRGFMFRKLFCNNYGQVITPDLMNFLSFFPSNFVLDNIIIDFNHEKILLSKDLLGILSSNFFTSFNRVFYDDNLDQTKIPKKVKPPCRQITLSSVTHLLVDDKAKAFFNFCSLRIPNISTMDPSFFLNGEFKNKQGIDSFQSVRYTNSESFLCKETNGNVHFHIPYLKELKFYKST